MWGASTQVTSKVATDGGQYVIAIYYNGDYYALPKASTMSSATTYSGTKVILNSDGKVNTSDATDITWTLQEGSTSGQFYIKQTIGNTTYYLYKNGTSGSTNRNIKTVTSGQHYWEFSQKENTYNTYNVKSLRGSASLYLTNDNGTSTIGVYTSTNSGITLLEVGDPVSATDLSVKTAPTKVNYKKGETLDLTGLVLDATVSGNHVDVTSGYTASPANGATLNSVGAQEVTFTYGGQTATQTIHVGDLESIALTTTNVKTNYDEGQSFDPANLVVTATYSDGEITPTTWTENVTASCSYDPSGALSTSNNKITVSYTWGNTTKSADIDINVNAGNPYTVTLNAGTGSSVASITEASFGAGVTLPTPTISVTGWSFAGWATASTTNTQTAPTLYAAGETYHPTDNTTLYAVYKFGYESETRFKRATSVSEITSSERIAIAYNDGKVLNTSINLSTTLSETDGIATPASNAIFKLSGDNTNGFTLTNGTKTLGTSGSGNSMAAALSSTNNLWTFSSSTYTTNVFHINNKGASGKALEVYSSAWKVYALTANGQAWSMRIYIPATDYVYNSNPVAIINPIIAWTTAGDKTLYLQNTNTYDNAANVTGIAKTATYTSSDATVATVSEAGVVTALKKGETTITAKVAKEVGVNTEASVTYTVTVKDASNIAGIKAITSSASVVAFTADLTDAIVTYVNGSHAYIEDASGAVYTSCGSSLTAGKKINGAVSGSVKAANKIDEITAITLSSATLTDGVAPAAAVITAATLAANKEDYEGKLVSIEAAKVTVSLESGETSGGKISDDNKTTEINLYAPKSNIEALKDAEGTFNGYISLYNGNSVRFNIYDQSQISLTRNAPTAQPLTFDDAPVVLDEETSAFTAFTGLTVGGAQGTVTYSIDSNDDGVVTSINPSNGTVVLSGNCGTATIKASAAARELTEAGVTTPYTATTETYTITVRPRYSSTFSVNGIETVVRQASYGAEITVPTPAATVGDYHFMGWKASSAIATPTDEAPTMVTPPTTPTSNVTYYAVYAQQTVGDDELVTFYSNTGTTGTDATSGVSMSATTNSSNGNSAPGFNLSQSLTMSSINLSGYKSPTSLYFDYKPGKSGSTYTTFVVKQYNSSNTVLSTTNVEGSDHQNYMRTDAISLDLSCVKIVITSSEWTSNCFIDNIEIKATRTNTSYYDYRTSLPTVNATIGSTTYSTFSYGREVTFPNDVEVYTAKVDASAKVVKLTKVTNGVVPANNGVILKANAGDYTATVTSTNASNLTNNELVATVTRTLVAKTDGTNFNYILQSDGNGGVVFNMATEAGAYMPSGRAYLSTTYQAPANGARLSVVFDDDATAIENVNVSKNLNGEVYNLNGQRVDNPTKGGLYIVNGKKVVIK